MFSLKGLAEALQGGVPDDVDEGEGEEAEQEDEEELLEGHEPEQDRESRDGQEGRQGPQLSFWGVATALSATVKARTSQVLTAVQGTDWRAELEVFQQGAKEDAEAVGKGADEAMHRALEAAEQLEHLPERLPSSAAALQARAEAASAAARARAGAGLAGLAGLGSKLVLGTHDLLEQISHAVQNEMSLIEDAGPGPRGSAGAVPGTTAGAARYSRFDADVAAMQRDSSTYCDEPEDGDDYRAWLAGFDLAAHRPDVERLIAENTFMSELQARIVPLIVEYEAFWTRYFYRLYRLELKHAACAQLAARGAAAPEQEEVGWSSDEEAEAAAEAQGAAEAAASGSAPGSAASLPDAEAKVVGTSGGPPSKAHDGGALSVSSQQQAGVEHRRAASGSDDSAAATLSSDSDHWQVVSPRQRAAAAAAAAAAMEAGAHGLAGASRAASPAVDSSPSACALASAMPMPGAPPAAQPSDGPRPAASAAAAASAAEQADGELSDWGDEDDAALALAAASGAGDGGDGGADAEEAWGSDWE